MMTELPEVPDPGTDTPQAFSVKAAAMVLAQKQMVNELNASIGSLNELFSGFPLSFRYVFDGQTSDADPGAGRLRLSSDPQFTATTMRIDTVTAGQAVNLNVLFDVLAAGTSSAKGTLRITAMTDPSRWILFDFTAVSASTAYRNFSIINRSGSGAASPILDGEDIVVTFQRNGDKGDTGPTYAHPTIYVREELAAGGYPPATQTGVWGRRLLNVVSWNSISGASLASNRVTLPAGTYEYSGSAPAAAALRNQIRLYCTTDALNFNNGTSEHAGNDGSSRSIVRGLFVISAPKTFELQHSAEQASTFMWGFPGSKGGAEVYSEIMFTKVS
jgi:hypothetical protein